MQLGRAGTELAFSLRSRTEDGVTGTNPEELVGAAHAGCFSMSLSNLVEEAGLDPVAIRTSAKVTLEQGADGFTISRVDLVTRGEVPGLDDAGFRALAEKAKATCPVSKLYAAAEITLDAEISGEGLG
jgi:osmotically inducible protein OsmC